MALRAQLRPAAAARRRTRRRSRSSPTPSSSQSARPPSSRRLKTVKGRHAQMLWLNGTRGHGKVALRVGPTEYWAFTSDPTEVAIRDDEIAEHDGNVWAAISALARRGTRAHRDQPTTGARVDDGQRPLEATDADRLARARARRTPVNRATSLAACGDRFASDRCWRCAGSCGGAGATHPRLSDRARRRTAADGAGAGRRHRRAERRDRRTTPASRRRARCSELAEQLAAGVPARAACSTPPPATGCGCSRPGPSSLALRRTTESELLLDARARGARADRDRLRHARPRSRPDRAGRGHARRVGAARDRARCRAAASACSTRLHRWPADELLVARHDVRQANAPLRELRRLAAERRAPARAGAAPARPRRPASSPRALEAAQVPLQAILGALRAMTSDRCRVDFDDRPRWMRQRPAIRRPARRVDCGSLVVQSDSPRRVQVAAPRSPARSSLACADRAGRARAVRGRGAPLAGVPVSPGSPRDPARRRASSSTTSARSRPSCGPAADRPDRRTGPARRAAGPAAPGRCGGSARRCSRRGRRERRRWSARASAPTARGWSARRCRTGPSSSPPTRSRSRSTCKAGDQRAPGRGYMLVVAARQRGAARARRRCSRLRDRMRSARILVLHAAAVAGGLAAACVRSWCRAPLRSAAHASRFPTLTLRRVHAQPTAACPTPPARAPRTAARASSPPPHSAVAQRRPLRRWRASRDRSLPLAASSSASRSPPASR